MALPTRSLDKKKVHGFTKTLHDFVVKVHGLKKSYMIRKNIHGINSYGRKVKRLFENFTKKTNLGFMKNHNNYKKSFTGQK